MLNTTVKTNGSRRYDFKGCHIPSREMKYLDPPRDWITAISRGNLGHQMRYSVRTLEAQFKHEGNPHILQLQLDNTSDPQYWKLYADGRKVAEGTGEYARECFFQSAETFRDLCRDAVETDKHVLKISEREYYLLKTARNISSIENAQDK